jgi:hypothetical protein
VVKAVYNTLLLLPWALMIFVPNLDFTKSMIRSNVFLVLFCAAYCYLFTAATAHAAPVLKLSHATLDGQAHTLIDCDMMLLSSVEILY